MDYNPYQTPKAQVDGAGASEVEAAEALRYQYLRHEASIRSIGLLYYLGGGGMLIVALMQLINIEETTLGAGLGLSAVLLLFSFLYFWLGSGLRVLKPKVRVPAGVVAALGLISFPVGTLINGYILYLLFSKKGKMVFSEEYNAALQLTPHVKYRTSPVVWFVLGLLVLALGAAIVVPMLKQ